MATAKSYLDSADLLKIKPNPAQANFLFTVLENEADFQNKEGKAYQTGFRATFNAGRGSGKTRALLMCLAEIVLALPHCKVGLASMTYLHVQNVVTSQARKVLEEYGLFEYDSKVRTWGHYVINKRPPEGWWNPYEGLNSYDNCMCFKNGATVVFLSADRPDTARGLNLDALLIDESFKIKEDFYNTVLRKTVRANKFMYQDPRPHRKGYNHPLHWVILDFTSAAWSPEQQWIYRTEDLMKQDPKRYFFMESTAYDNLENLPGNFIENERESSLSELAFDIEVLNRRFTKLENGYYPSLSLRKHSYSNMYDYVFDSGKQLSVEKRVDYDVHLPLELSCDFNAKFTCMLVCQSFPKELRFIDNMYVKRSEKTLVDDLINNFCKKYGSHKKKVVYLYGDNSGKKNDPGRKTHYQQIEAVLKKHGWSVVNCVQNSYPPYKIRYQVINTILSEELITVPRIRINELECKSLLISLQHTPIIGDSFEKDKRSELSNKIDQQYATHYSDAFDYIVFKKFSRIVPLASWSSTRRLVA